MKTKTQKKEKPITEAGLKRKLKALGSITDQQKREIACSLIGHSRIQSTCFGYFNCGRCGVQLGDALASVYPGAEKVVIIGHKCKVCEKNFKECTWQDKFMCPDPFAK